MKGLGESLHERIICRRAARMLIVPINFRAAIFGLISSTRSPHNRSTSAPGPISRFIATASSRSLPTLYGRSWGRFAAAHSKPTSAARMLIAAALALPGKTRRVASRTASNPMPFFAVTEPTPGTVTTSLKTFARRDGDHYVVTGQKVFISRVQHSDLMLLLARTTPLEQVDKRTEGLSVFLVDLRAAIGNGLTVRPIANMVNHETNELFFDSLKVPAANLIGEEGKGFRYILDGMNAERILIAAECIGDGYWFVDRARQYAGERVVFGRPIGQNQGVQFPIAQAYAHVRAADLMRYEAAELFDAGQPCGAEANLAKLLAADASWEAANVCLQTHGGFGFANEYYVERKFRETRLYQVAPISTNLILAYLGEHVLGLPRSY